ncbi:hypothetical protein ACA910_003403 [Epithemia clementina (nom. ined.)]
MLLPSHLQKHHYLMIGRAKKVGSTKTSHSNLHGQQTTISVLATSKATGKNNVTKDDDPSMLSSGASFDSVLSEMLTGGSHDVLECSTAAGVCNYGDDNSNDDGDKKISASALSSNGKHKQESHTDEDLQTAHDNEEESDTEIHKENNSAYKASQNLLFSLSRAATYSGLPPPQLLAP